jgi:hypothetical protein
MGEEKPPVHEAESTLKAEWERVKNYREGSRAVQRMMANLPNYMIFDDHEITDDWYLNKEWKKKVLKADLGRRIIANGIAAFWLFQAIGNDVSHFANDAVLKLLTPPLAHHIDNLKTDKKATGKASKAFEKVFLKLDNWSFVTPTAPPILFLNTRTRRTRSASHRHSLHGLLAHRVDSFPSVAARLLNSNEIADVRSKLTQMAARDSRLIIVAPTPIVGLDSAEEAINFIVSKGGSSSFFDFETYHSDLNSFLDISQLLLELTPQPELVIMLSGDVHYGFSVAATLLNMDKHLPSIPIAQFTSSAMKNMPEGIAESLLKVFSTKIHSPIDFHFWWRPGSQNSAHSRIHVAPVEPDSQGQIGLNSRFVKDHHKNFADLSKGARLRMAAAYQFERASLTSVVEKENNLGLLELANLQVSHRLLKWNGSYSESLETRWNARSWPVSIV